MTLMGQAAFTPMISIGALELSYPTYCTTLRILIRQGKSLEQIQRSACWDRLRILHHCLPGTYRAPGQMYALLKREIGA